MDVDGTLYAVPRLRAAWRLRRHRGLLVALLAAREKIRHEAPQSGPEALAAREAELVAPSFGLTQTQAMEALLGLRSEIADALTRGVRPYRGVAEALWNAARQGLRLAILSDYDPIDKLRNLGLDGLPWSVTLGAEQLGALKPHSHSFIEVARRLGVEPSHVVHIGDREDLDVEGALRAGMRAWRFAPRGAPGSRSERVITAWGGDLFAGIAVGGGSVERLPR